jgi:hypothetical protein
MKRVVRFAAAFSIHDSSVAMRCPCSRFQYINNGNFISHVADYVFMCRAPGIFLELTILTADVSDSFTSREVPVFRSALHPSS